MTQVLVALSLALVGAGGKVSTIQITNDYGAPIFLQDFEWSGISIEGAAVVQDDACLNRCGLFQGNAVCAAAARLPTVGASSTSEDEVFAVQVSSGAARFSGSVL